MDWCPTPGRRLRIGVMLVDGDVGFGSCSCTSLHIFYKGRTRAPWLRRLASRTTWALPRAPRPAAAPLCWPSSRPSRRTSSSKVGGLPLGTWLRLQPTSPWMESAGWGWVTRPCFRLEHTRTLYIHPVLHRCCDRPGPPRPPLNEQYMYCKRAGTSSSYPMQCCGPPLPSALQARAGMVPRRRPRWRACWTPTRQRKAWLAGEKEVGDGLPTCTCTSVKEEKRHGKRSLGRSRTRVQLCLCHVDHPCTPSTPLSLPHKHARTQVKAERVAQAVARVDKQLSQLVSGPVIGLLESCAPGMWPRLHAVCRRAEQASERELMQVRVACVCVRVCACMHALVCVRACVRARARRRCRTEHALVCVRV